MNSWEITLTVIGGVLLYFLMGCLITAILAVVFEEGPIARRDWSYKPYALGVIGWPMILPVGLVVGGVYGACVGCASLTELLSRKLAR